MAVLGMLGLLHHVQVGQVQGRGQDWVLRQRNLQPIMGMLGHAWPAAPRAGEKTARPATNILRIEKTSPSCSVPDYLLLQYFLPLKSLPVHWSRAMLCGVIDLKHTLGHSNLS